MRFDEATRGWGGNECNEVVVCIVLDRQDHGPEFEASEDEMNDLLTALHLEAVIMDLRIRMMEAILGGLDEYALTLQLLILVRTDELDAYKWTMPERQWCIYETMHP